MKYCHAKNKYYIDSTSAEFDQLNKPHFINLNMDLLQMMNRTAKTYTIFLRF